MRLADQSNFYPVLNKQYAIRIAREWNVPSCRAAYVTRFHLETGCTPIPSQRGGGRSIVELWVRAEELTDFNSHIV